MTKYMEIPEYSCSICGNTISFVEEQDYCLCPICGAEIISTNREYEQAIEDLEHDILWEPTFNPEDGSM